MKKEIIIRYVIDDEKGVVGAIVNKSGFPEALSSQYTIIGMLNKILLDEQAKLNKMLIAQQEFTKRDL